ncbi:unnamed protein product, partial [Prorocentrum cordatum]
ASMWLAQGKRHGVLRRQLAAKDRACARLWRRLERGPPPRIGGGQRADSAPERRARPSGWARPPRRQRPRARCAPGFAACLRRDDAAAQAQAWLAVDRGGAQEKG